jgi:hypothetical protein
MDPPSVVALWIKNLNVFLNDNSLVQVRVLDLMKFGFPIQIQFQHNFEHMIK